MQGCLKYFQCLDRPSKNSKEVYVTLGCGPMFRPPSYKIAPVSSTRAALQVALPKNCLCITLGSFLVGLTKSAIIKMDYAGNNLG